MEVSNTTFSFEGVLLGDENYSIIMSICFCQWTFDLFLRKSEMSSQTGSIFPLVLTLHTMTRNLIIGDCHVCLTTVLDQSRLISVALSIDFLVKKWVNAMAMRMIAMCRISWRCKPSGCPLVNCREKKHCTW